MQGGREQVSYDELAAEALPWTDATIKEALRLNAPLAFTARIARRDSVIPLSKAYPTHDGKST